MTIGKRLLDLTWEYKVSTDARAESWGVDSGKAVGREPSVIAADYEEALKDLLQSVNNR